MRWLPVRKNAVVGSQQLLETGGVIPKFHDCDRQEIGTETENQILDIVAEDSSFTSRSNTRQVKVSGQYIKFPQTIVIATLHTKNSSPLT